MSVNWDEMHLRGERPWDLKGVTPMLKFLFDCDVKGRELRQSEEIKRILVPGCGQKYDSEFLALIFPAAEIVGLDLSPTAIKSCREGTVGMSNLKFIEGDFFVPSQGLGKFDLIFDHTFFCAIKPELRPQWARQMTNLLNPSGFLLTLIYPLPRDPAKGPDLRTGPPFEVDFETYERILGMKCCARWDRDSVPTSNEKRKGREELALWQKP